MILKTPSSYRLDSFKSVLQVTILLCYAGSAFLLGSKSYGNNQTSFTRSAMPALGLGFAGFLVHTYTLASAVLSDSGLNLNLGNSVSLVAWQVALIALLAATSRALRGLAALMLPLAAAGAWTTAIDMAGFRTTNLSWQLEVHILLSALAYSLLSISAATAVFMAIQDRTLKRRQPYGVMRILPPVESMDRVLFATLVAGFGLLSLAVFSGLIFVEDMFAQHLAHKTILSLLAWLVFAILLLGRWRLGWRGRRAVRWTLGGFTMLVLAYFGSKLVLEVFLGRQWG